MIISFPSAFNKLTYHTKRNYFRLGTNFHVFLMSSHGFASPFPRMLYTAYSPVLPESPLNMTFAVSLHQICTSLLLMIVFKRSNSRLSYPSNAFSATLDPHFFFLTHLSKLSIFGYPSSLFLSIFTGSVCSHCQSCDSSL